MATETKVFQTSDTPLAAYLILKGFKLQEITYTHKAFFSFAYSNGELTKEVGEYTTEEATGNIVKYFTIYQRLISSLKEGKHNVE